MIMMKSLIPIFCCLFFNCSSQDKNLYQPIKAQQVTVKGLKSKLYTLNDSNYIGFTLSSINPNDGSWDKNLIHVSGAGSPKIETISKTDISDGIYSDTLFFFKDSRENQVFLWKLEGEYWSYLEFFLFKNGRIYQIGDVVLGVQCEECDSFNYPADQIQVFGVDDSISILFEKPLIYRGSESQEQPYHSINTPLNSLQLIYSNGRMTIK